MTQTCLPLPKQKLSVKKVEEERGKPTEVKIYLLEQFLASNSGEDVGNRQQHLEIFLAQEGCNENPYFAGEAGTCVRLEFPAVSNVLLNRAAGSLPPAHGGPATTSRTSLRHFRDLASRRLRYLRGSPHVQKGGKVLPTAQAKTKRGTNLCGHQGRNQRPTSSSPATTGLLRHPSWPNSGSVDTIGPRSRPMI